MSLMESNQTLASGDPSSHTTFKISKLTSTSVEMLQEQTNMYLHFLFN